MSDQVFPDVVLRTQRLVLRALREEDVDAIVAAVSDPVTKRWLPLPDSYTREDAMSWVCEKAPATRAGGYERMPRAARLERCDSTNVSSESVGGPPLKRAKLLGRRRSRRGA